MIIAQTDVNKCHFIRDGHPDIHRTAYYLEYLVFHMPEAKRTIALDWLIKNGIRGQKFLDFVSNECKNSGLEFLRYLTMRVEKEKKQRALFAKDLL